MKYKEVKKGNVIQFETDDGELMMLPSDMALLQDPWRKYVDIYANDQDTFFDDFSKAYGKLMNLGFHKSKL